MYIADNYTYSADGTKLKVEMKVGSQIKTTDYIGNKIYENGILKRILVDGGYIENGEYYFYIQDHLGNNRVVAKADGSVIQTNHYYPFGMTFTEDGTGDAKAQPYKYNGKEFDGERGLNLYDYMARSMDPALERFTSIDPLAEKYYSISPYSYVINNPIRFIDPDGRIVKPAPGSSQDFIKNYEAASKILISKGVGHSFNQLVNTKDVYYIKQGRPSYCTSNLTISWNPSMAVEANGKIILSPTGVLGHEIEHAKNHDDARQAFMKGNKDDFNKWRAGVKPGTSADYKIKEEENVITGPEQNIAKALGSIGKEETTRNNHKGILVRVDGINSLKKIKIFKPLPFQRVELALPIINLDKKL